MNRLFTSDIKQLFRNCSSFYGYSRQYTLTTLFFLLWINCLAQKKDTIDISNQLYNPFYKICQTDTAVFPIFYGYQMYENSPITKTDFYRVLGSKKDNNCRTEYIESIDNKSLKLEGDGVNVLSYELKPSANSFPAYWVVSAKFNTTGTPIISWKTGVIYGQNDCGYESTETLYRGTYRKIFSIPKPQTPTLTALKAVLKPGESTTIVCSDCPNTLAGETVYPYSNGSVDAAFSFQCGPSGQPDFNYSVIRYYGPPYALPFDSRQIFYKPGAVFHARCNDNGCLSEISGPVAVSIQYTAPTCGDSKMDEIDSYSRDGRKDYHQYTVETFVCDKADGNPNCTQQKVFDLMKSKKTNMVAIAADFPGALPEVKNLLETKVQLFGSDLVFHLPSTPVNNCETFNLAGPVSLAMNLSTLEAFNRVGGLAIYPAILSQIATRQTLIPIANPVAQFIDEAAFTITNYTKFGHALHPGKVVRTVVDECNRIKIVTIGVGRHFLGDNAAGQAMGERNITSGTALFKNVDQRLIEEFNKLPK